MTRDSVIRLLPPLICDEMQIDDMVVRLARLLSSNTAGMLSHPMPSKPEPSKLKDAPHV